MKEKLDQQQRCQSNMEIPDEGLSFAGDTVASTQEIGREHIIEQWKILAKKMGWIASPQLLNLEAMRNPSEPEPDEFAKLIAEDQRRRVKFDVLNFI